MKIKFPFRLEKSKIIESVYRPVAHVILINGQNELSSVMYVDSGADVTVVPYSNGISLGFEINEKDEIKKLSGIGGSSISVIIRECTIKIGEKQFNGRIAWSLSEDVPLILGRLDVFDRFKVTFDQKNKVTVLEYKD